MSSAKIAEAKTSNANNQKMTQSQNLTSTSAVPQCPESCNFAHSTRTSIPNDVFCWKRYLEKKHNANTLPSLDAFGDHIPLPKVWANRVKGLYIEFSVMSNYRRWFYKIEQTVGYYLVISPLGNPTQKLWIHILCPHYYAFSYSSKGRSGQVMIVPPFPHDKSLVKKLIAEMNEERQLGGLFYPDVIYHLEQHRKSICEFTVGNVVEVMDINCFGYMREAFIRSIGANGHVIELFYRPLQKKELKNRTCEQFQQFMQNQNEEELEKYRFWVSPFSKLIHPVGWSKDVGHKHESPCECSCSPRHDIESGSKFKIPQFLSEEKEKSSTPKWKKFMKLEVVDLLSLNVITVGTVVKVLKHGYLMIAVDGKAFDLGHEGEHICVHKTSPFLLPLGFCDKYKTQLKPPPHYRGKFLWPDYLFTAGAVGVPDECITDYMALNEGKPRLVVGSRIEAIDLLHPSLLLPATVHEVAGHLIRVNFDSWPQKHDQWKYMYGEDIFPIGFCELVRYELAPPKKFLNQAKAERLGIVFEQVEVVDNNNSSDIEEEDEPLMNLLRTTEVPDSENCSENVSS